MSFATVAHSDEVGEANKELARAHMKVGHEAMDSGEYSKAYDAFKAADDIMHVTSTGFHTARALVGMGRLVEARALLLEVVDLPGIGSEHPQLAEARESAAELSGDLADRIPTFSLSLEGLPPEATPEITVDGRAVSVEEQPIDPGRHRIIGNAEGFHTAELNIIIAEHDERAFTLRFVPADEPAPGPVDEGEGMALWPFVLYGAAGASAIVGAITGGLSLSEASAAKQGCVDSRCPAANEPAADASLNLAHVSTATFALAGALAVAGSVGLVLELQGDPDGQTPSAGLRLSPLGATLQGSF